MIVSITGALQQWGHEGGTVVIKVRGLRGIEGRRPVGAGLLGFLVFIQGQLIVLALSVEGLVLIWARLLAV